MDMPRISVIMPFYNCENFLDEAIASILGQTFSDFELIIINDASTDQSDDIVQKYLIDPRIVYIKNEKNKKITRNLNRGLDLAKADIVARMDGDDVCEPTRFQEQYDFLTKNEGIALVGSYAMFIDHNGIDIGKKIKPTDSESIKKDIFIYSPFIHPAVMFRKQVILDLGRYNEDYSHCQDYDLWLRLIYSGYETANIPKILLKYRVYDNSSNKRIREIAKNDFTIRKNAISKFNLKLTLRELFFMYFHFILSVLITGKQKQKLEGLYKKFFYGE